MKHILAVALIFVFATADAALIGRLPSTPDGTDYQAYYDTALDLTWAADANINGADTWANQLSWAAGLNIGGVTGWRLPSPDLSCGDSSCTTSEMGHLFHTELENPVNGPLMNSGPFSNVQTSTRYWLNMEVAANPNRAWNFSFNFGDQDSVSKAFSLGAWAIHDGDVGVIPVPATVWLFGSSLLGLIGISTRRKSA